VNFIDPSGTEKKKCVMETHTRICTWVKSDDTARDPAQGSGPGLGHLAGGGGGSGGGYFVRVRSNAPAQVGANGELVVTAMYRWVHLFNWQQGGRFADRYRPGGRISQAQVCLRGCHGVDTLPTDRYSTEEEDAQLRGTAFTIIATAVPAARGVSIFNQLLRNGVGTTAAQSGFLGVRSSRFGHPAFGASRMGSWNTGRVRIGWGRGQNSANFRFGVDSNKRDVLVVPIPRGGF